MNWNFALGMAGISAGTAAVNQYFSSQSNRVQFKAMAQQYEAQAQLNELQAKQSRQDEYNARKMGNWQAMQRGLADRAKLGQIKVSQSGSGVQMGSGSAKEVVNSQQMMGEMNQIAIQQNTTASAMQARVNTANYLANAEINRGNAQAANTMRNSIDAVANAISGAGLAFGTSLLGSYGSSLLMQETAGAVASTATSSATIQSPNFGLGVSTGYTNQSFSGFNPKFGV